MFLSEDDYIVVGQSRYVFDPFAMGKNGQCPVGVSLWDI
jgi:hypothetical protein